MRPVSIRDFAEGDLPALAGLLTELGYPTTVDQMRTRMRRIVAHPDYATIVAESDGKVIGMVGVFITVSYEHDHPVGRITAMVVGEAARGNGVGKALVTAAEAWVRARGADRLSLTSHVRRDGAHAFYRRVGYSETGKRFVREF